VRGARQSQRSVTATDGSSKGVRPSPRIPNPHEIESGFVGQVGFLGSKSGQLERSLAPGSHSSPAARLAWYSQQQQQRSCSAVTASPSVEGSEQSHFNADLSPYFSPIITTNIGRGINAGNSPPDNPTQAQDAGKKNSGWSPADKTEEDPFSTVVARTWGRNVKDSDTCPVVDANFFLAFGDPTTLGVKSVCTDLSARRTDSSGTVQHDINTDNCDGRQDVQTDKRGTCVHGQGAAKHNIVDDEGHEDRQLGHVKTADTTAKQTTASTLLFSPDERDSFQNTPSTGSYRVQGRRLSHTMSRKSRVNDEDREIQIQNAIERVAYELDYLQDELSSISSHETAGDQSDDTLSAHSTPVYGPAGVTDDVIKSVTQNSDPPGAVANDAHMAGCKPFAVMPSVSQRDRPSASPDDSSFSSQSRARSLRARPTQPSLPAGDPPAVYRVHDQAQRIPTRHNDRVDAATSPIDLSLPQSRYFTVHKCQTGLSPESGFSSNSVASVSQTAPIVDTSRGLSSGATRYETTGSWVKDVNSRRSDEPFNGHARDATFQSHSDTWADDDVSMLNAHEVNEVRGQAGQGCRAMTKAVSRQLTKSQKTVAQKHSRKRLVMTISHVIETIADASVVNRTTATLFLPIVKPFDLVGVLTPLNQNVLAKRRVTGVL